MTNPLCKASFEINELHDDFNSFLRRLRSGENHAEKYGVAVIEEWPPNCHLSQRGDATKFEVDKSFMIVTEGCTAIKCSGGGIYYINSERRRETFKWIQDRESESASASEDPMSIKSFVERDLCNCLTGAIPDDITIGPFEQNPNLGQQSLFIHIAPQPNRNFLKIIRFPIYIRALKDEAFNHKDIRAKTEKFITRNLRIFCASAPSTVGMNPVGLTSILFHHRGKPYEWIIVPPTEKESFEGRLRTHLCISPETNLCSQFISHNNLWICPSLLETWGIKFHTVVQAENQMVVIFPDSYYWGFSHGFGMIEIYLYAGKDWNYADYQFCDPMNTVCSDYGELVGR